MISFLVSHHERPVALACCLASLRQQGDHEIIVCDNSLSLHGAEEARKLCIQFDARYQFFGRSGDCYGPSAEAAVEAVGEFLCFPSDDSYYVPGFASIMEEYARRCSLDLVYCDFIYDPRAGGTYRVLDGHPCMGSIDKTSFILRKSAFRGFPPHPNDWRDGALIEQLVREGIRHGKAPGVLLFHN